MRIIESGTIFRQLRAAPPGFQQTFQTPLDDLPRFVSTILSSFRDHRRASVELVQVVFNPSYGLASLVEKYSIVHDWRNGTCVEAEGLLETRDLLVAVLSEWMDFAFVASPDQFAIYADHDEYITFFANKKSDLASLTDALNVAGFKAVNWERRF